MSRSNRKTVIAVIIAVSSLLNLPAAQTLSGARVTKKPFMLFVTPFPPPPGSVVPARIFAQECFEKIRAIFDSTSFQAVSVASVDAATTMSNQKKDILLITEDADRYTDQYGRLTLAIWLRYRVGLLHSKVEVPCVKGNEAGLTAAIAEGILKAVQNDFSGTLELTGGPAGTTVMLTEGVTVTLPGSMMFPSGDYYIVSGYPEFQTRTDTIEIYPGKVTKKRILLLPEEVTGRR